jgi:hypothetical protein
MNTEDIIRMAREAGASSSGISLIIGIEDFFERFAALVAAAVKAEREWVGLTDEERYLGDARSEEEIEYARAIEAKLKEKNT